MNVRQIKVLNHTVFHEYLRRTLHTDRRAAFPSVRGVAPESVSLEQDQLLPASGLHKLVGHICKIQSSRENQRTMTNSNRGAYHITGCQEQVMVGQGTEDE